jgi:hypothetical protein
MSRRATLTRLLMLSGALLGMSACTSPSPTEPGAGQLGGRLERRIGDVGGGGSVCVPTAILCFPVNLTLTATDGSELNLRCTADRTQLPLVLNGCNVFSGTGRFQDARGDGDGTFVTISADGSEVDAILEFTLRDNGGPFITYLSSGTLSSSVAVLNTGTCSPAATWLEVNFGGTLPHLGSVTGTVTSVCGG